MRWICSSNYETDHWLKIKILLSAVEIYAVKHQQWHKIEQFFGMILFGLLLPIWISVL